MLAFAAGGIRGWHTESSGGGQDAVLFDIPEVVEEEPLFAVLADDVFHGDGELAHDTGNGVAVFVGPDGFFDDVAEGVVRHAHHEDGQDRRAGSEGEFGGAVRQARRASEEFDGVVRAAEIPVAEDGDDFVSAQGANAFAGGATKGDGIDFAADPVALLQVVDAGIGLPEGDGVEFIAALGKGGGAEFPVAEVGTDEDAALAVRQERVENWPDVAEIDEPVDAFGREIEEVEEVENVLGEVEKVFARERPQCPGRECDATVLVDLAEISNNAFPAAPVEQDIQIGNASRKAIADTARQKTRKEFRDLELEVL